MTSLSRLAQSTMAEEVSSEVCTICDKASAKFCNRCKSARYCSKKCQRSDWPIHRLLCGPFSDLTLDSRPSGEHLRAIVLPVDEDMPKFIWLHCQWHHDDDDDYYGPFQFPDANTILGSDTLNKSMQIQLNAVLGKELSDTIRLCHRDTFLVDGSKTNQSVTTIATATKTEYYHDWRGPLVAYGTKGLGIDQSHCRDLDMNDFRHLADYLVSYGREPRPAPRAASGTMVKGVRINCVGDKNVVKRPHFESVEVPPTDPIFSEYKHERDTSDIADRIGLPIFTRQLSPDPRWAFPKDKEVNKREYPFVNQDATFLHQCCDPRAKGSLASGTLGWGWSPMKWQNDVGSVLVVRQDRKPLHPLHVEALCRYCSETRALIAHNLGEYAPDEPLTKDAVLAMICRPTFSILWYRLTTEKHAKGEDTRAPFPYTPDEDD